MNRKLRASLSLIASLPCFAAACGPAIVPFAGPSAIATVPVVVPTAAPSAAPAEAVACTDSAPSLRVAKLDDAWPAQDFLKGPADDGAPVKKACEKIAERGEKARQDGPGTADSRLEPLGRCFASPTGAWALDAGKAGKPDPIEGLDDDGWSVPYSLTYVTATGQLVRSKGIGSGEVIARSGNERAAEVVAVFDFDGDGVSELVTKEWEDWGGESYSDALRVYTYRDGEVKAYAPAEGLEIQGVIDADFDGRPDFAVPGSMHVEGPCGMDGQTFSSPMQLAHSIAGGGFSLDDAVAREVLRLACGPMERELLAFDRTGGQSIVEPYESTRRITCARIYGMSPKEATGRVRAAHPNTARRVYGDDSHDPSYCFSLAAMLDLAAQEPTFTTAAPCPGG